VASQCANPDCRAPLRYLRDGRLFQFEVRAVDRPGLERLGQSPQKVSRQRQVSHFWLCGQCSLAMTLIFDNVRGVIVIPLQSANESVTRTER
jgi:hypothetical protein